MVTVLAYLLLIEKTNVNKLSQFLDQSQNKEGQEMKRQILALLAGAMFIKEIKEEIKEGHSRIKEGYFPV